jgi:beta-1,4-mannosyl-glycoprotein beta-1,4-N-acetylglucosaminyltransferase
MIVDCFTFFNGLDILEIRLNTLAPYVDKFVLCESPYNMVGEKKRLYFDEAKDRFKEFNIQHLIVHDHLNHMIPEWEPYYYQLDYMSRALTDVDDEDMLLVSDFDEIPDLEHYQYLEGAFVQKLYYYYLNVLTSITKWKGTVAVRKKNARSIGRVRRRRTHYPSVGTGWHFSYISSPEDIIHKIESCCHRGLDTPEVKVRIVENKRNLIDPFNRNIPLKVEMPSGPGWLLDNRNRYEDLFYK